MMNEIGNTFSTDHDKQCFTRCNLVGEINGEEAVVQEQHTLYVTEEGSMFQ